MRIDSSKLLLRRTSILECSLELFVKVDDKYKIIQNIYILILNLRNSLLTNHFNFIF